MLSTNGTDGIVEGRVLENAAATGRDVRNHMLFEVSTEAANRGTTVDPFPSLFSTDEFRSWRHLLRDQVESPSHHGRIWRPIYAHWPPQPGIGM